MASAFLLKLSAYTIIPASATTTTPDHVAFCFRKVIAYDIHIEEGGRIYFNFYHHGKMVFVNTNSPTNPVFNPDWVLNNMVKAVRFIESLNDYVLEVDAQWLADGVNHIINGSGDIFVPIQAPIRNPIDPNLPIYGHRGEYLSLEEIVSKAQIIYKQSRLRSIDNISKQLRP